VPGLLICAGLMVLAWVEAFRGKYGVLTARPTLGEGLRQTVKALPLIGLPILIVGGIISGVFTVTESAAIGVAYTLAVGFLWTRRLRFRDVYDATIYSAIISSVVGMLMGAGVILSWIFTLNRVTDRMADFLISLTTDPTVFLALVAGTLILLGMLIDAVPLIIALAPLLTPIARLYGIDDLQFGLVFILSSMIGLVTPPVGIILFMTASIAKMPVEKLALAILPFVGWMIAVVGLIVIFPSLTLWLPRTLGF
jgi:TRAP-type transport system large permease protein